MFDAEIIIQAEQQEETPPKPENPDKRIIANKIYALKSRVKFLREVEQEYLIDNRKSDAAAIGKIIYECFILIDKLKRGAPVDWSEIPKQEE